MTANFGGGAIVVCYGWGEGDDQLWGSGFGATAGCHCSVLWRGKGRVTTNFGGVDVPLQGAHGTFYSNGIQKNIQKSCLELLADVTVFSTLMTQKLFFAIWGLCWHNFVIPIVHLLLDIMQTITIYHILRIDLNQVNLNKHRYEVQHN